MVQIWDAVAGGRPLQTISAHRGAVYLLAVRPDGRQFATGGENGLVRTWNPETGLADLPLIDRGASISALAYEPESTVLALGSMDGTVRVWSATFGRRRLGPISHPDHLTSLAFSPAAHFLSGGGGEMDRGGTISGMVQKEVTFDAGCGWGPQRS